MERFALAAVAPSCAVSLGIGARLLGLAFFPPDGYLRRTERGAVGA